MTTETNATVPPPALAGAAAAAGAESKTVAGAGAGAETKPAAAAGAETPEAKAAAATAAAAAQATKEAADLAGKPFTDAAQLKLADGQKLDDAAVKDFLAVAKEHGFTAKQAQGLVEYQLKSNAAVETARTAARDATAKTTAEALKSDKDIGGSKFDASMKLATKALAYIASPELNEQLKSARLEDGSMLGDQIWFAKILVSLGQKVSDDSLGNGGKGGAPKTEKSLAEHLYGPGTVQAGPVS